MSEKWRWESCCTNKGGKVSFGDRREMPGIRFEMAGNDGSWFATIRRGTLAAFASCVIYASYIPEGEASPRPAPPGISVTYVATCREKTIFENISFARLALLTLLSFIIPSVGCLFLSYSVLFDLCEGKWLSGCRQRFEINFLELDVLIFFPFKPLLDFRCIIEIP